MTTTHLGRRTALFEEHVALGASMTDFGGWQMPLIYSTHLAEHHAVRRAAGLFDVSHMGTVEVNGEQAGAFLDHALVGRLSAIVPGQAKYSLLCAEDGGIIDDLISYRTSRTGFVLVPNAANTAAVVGALHERSAGFDVSVRDITEQTALLAVQGPAAEATVLKLASKPETVRELRYYASMETMIAGARVRLARTGYTGEDGFELFVPSERAPALWRALVEAGVAHELVPAGLAARDSLRLEAGMPLYGNELSRGVDPFTAGLGGVVGLAKKTSDFVGRSALEAAKAAHVEQAPGRRVLVGLAGEGRKAARSGYPVLTDGSEIGTVTSGMLSPTLGHPIALAIVDAAHAATGTRLDVDVRGRTAPFTVVERPFYRRGKV